MKTQRHIGNNTGMLGESIVCRYFQGKGFGIKERNYLKPWGEIDLVVEKGGTTHFLEVKAVTCGFKEGIAPEENLHPAKIKRFKMAINSYLADHSVDKWQMDAVLVYLDIENKKAKVAIVENVQ